LENKFVTVDQTGLCDSIIETDVEGDEGNTSSRFLDIVYKLYKFEEFLFLVPVANFRIYVTLLTMTPRYPRLHIEHVIHLQFHLVRLYTMSKNLLLVTRVEISLGCFLAKIYPAVLPIQFGHHY
jgi:hypothetical protein